MKTKIVVLIFVCSLSVRAFAQSNGNTSGMALATNTSMPSVTNNPPGSASPATNANPGYHSSESNNVSSYVPPGYQNPSANYTNPYYNYTNLYWAAHNTNDYGSTNAYVNTNWANANTNQLNVATNRHRWWK